MPSTAALLRKATVSALLCAAPLLAQSQDSKTQDTPPPIRDYIRASWNSLSRSMSDCKSLRDPKVTTAPILYLPAGMAVPPAVAKLHAECGVEVQPLPKPIGKLGDLRPEELKRPGLLYLPNRYVVPGGRFNEMYGWDSYFIVLGLLSDGRMDLARDMAENFFFEIENYGALLNANRTYFLTRSQPPLLAEFIREIHEQDLAKKSSFRPEGAQPTPSETKNSNPRPQRKNLPSSAMPTNPDAPTNPGSPTNPNPQQWLAHAYTVAKKDYALWTGPLHQAGNTGLARYFDIGEGPVLEMADDSSYYPDAIRYLLGHRSEARDYLVPASAGDAASCDQKLTHVCQTAEVDAMRLSRDFYRGDRADRESGFDTTFRFGPFSGSTHHFAPVCLNSLLYRYEIDMAGFATDLHKPAEAKHWRSLAAQRRAAINRYLWSGAQGAFVDYDYTTGKQSTYLYSTAFYPLWAGIATPGQGKRIAALLPRLEHEHGLAMSDQRSGMQWDLPFGWAPEQYFAILGLNRYGFQTDADRLSQKFRTDVETNYTREGNIREKYDVESGTTTTQAIIGYKSNGIGFGWTNGVYLRLLPAK